MATIYIVDDEPHIGQTIQSILQEEGYTVNVCMDGLSFLKQLSDVPADLVFLDVWLPGTDGMKILRQLRDDFPQTPVVMMSGHAGIEAAVQSMKHGAIDFLEKPLDLDVLLGTVESVLSKSKGSNTSAQPKASVPKSKTSKSAKKAILQSTQNLQQTLKGNVVLNGTGLLSGRNTGIILSPAEENTGITFECLDGTTIPGHVSALDNFEPPKNNQAFTANSTVLASGRSKIRTVEHLLASLHMLDIHNVHIKVDEEIPNVDGSAQNFCELIQDVGIVQQKEHSKQVVIQEKISLGTEDDEHKHIYVEPFDGFEVEMRVNYPEPILEQRCLFNPQKHSFVQEIAPARSFNTFENIDMAQRSGAVGSGYLNSHIILHDGKVINTELRFADEFVRHKVLDLLGDLYLLGYPIQGRVYANMTSHGYNQALAYQIFQALSH